MFDNMNVEQVDAAIEICKGKVETESSGNVTPDQVPQMSAAGVDYISIGQITHSVKSFDFSLVKAGDFPG
jgi:nicotinate-nucleotide pyrophosphorylase (carboxylating)